jgi:hypothetical protein
MRSKPKTFKELDISILQQVGDAALLSLNQNTSRKRTHLLILISALRIACLSYQGVQVTYFTTSINAVYFPSRLNVTYIFMHY